MSTNPQKPRQRVWRSRASTIVLQQFTLAPKRFFRLDNFIRSMVYQSLKASQSAQQPTK